jgi:hypothetical protein
VRRLRSIALRLVQAAALLLAAIGVTLFSAPWWAPGWIAHHVEQRAQAVGVTARLDGLRVSFGGRWSVEGLHLSRGDARVDCTDVTLFVGSWSRAFSDRRVERVQANVCVLTSHEAAHETQPTDEAPESESWAERAPELQARARRFASYADHWNIELIQVEHPRLRATAGAVHAAVLGEYIDIHANIDVLSPRRFAAQRTRVSWRADGTARVEPNGPLRIESAVFEAARIEVDPAGVLTIEEGTARTGLDLIPEATFELLRLSGPRSCPRVDLHQATLRVGARDPSNHGRPEEPSGESDEEGPSRDEAVVDPTDDAPVRRRRRRERDGGVVAPDAIEPADREERIRVSGMDRLLSVARLVTAFDAQARRAHAFRRPCVDLELHGTQIEVGDRNPIVVDAFSLDPDGTLGATLSFDGVEISLSTTLSDLRSLRATAGPVDIAPLSGWLGDGTRLGGLATASGEVSRQPDGRLRFEGALELEQVLFERAAVSPHPLEGMNLRGSLVVEAGNIDAPSVTLRAEGSFADVPLEFVLDVLPEDADHFRLSGHVAVTASTACQTMYEAIPLGMLPNLGHTAFRFSGSSTPRLGVHYRLGDPWSFQLITEGFPGTCAIVRAERQWDPRQLLSDRYVHHVVEGTTRPDIFTGPGSASWTPIESVPGYVPAVMYLSEEINFFSNPGISLHFVAKAISRNLERGRYRAGGSTVSQQLVKNLFLSRAKSLSRKLEEILIVWAMEQWVPKGRILELYMNCIEFGPNIYGIRAAAEHYFGVRPQDLTPLEAAFLAGLKPSPLAGERYRLQGHSHLTGWWPNRLREILLRLVRHGGFISRAEVDAYAPWVVAFPTSPNHGASDTARTPRPDWVHSHGLVRIGPSGILDPPVPEDFDPLGVSPSLDEMPELAPSMIDPQTPAVPVAPHPAGLLGDTPADPTPAPTTVAPPEETPRVASPAPPPLPPSVNPASPPPASTVQPQPESSAAPAGDDEPENAGDVTLPSAQPASAPRVTSPEEALRGLQRAPSW